MLRFLLCAALVCRACCLSQRTRGASSRASTFSPAHGTSRRQLLLEGVSLGALLLPTAAAADVTVPDLGLDKSVAKSVSLAESVRRPLFDRAATSLQDVDVSYPIWLWGTWDVTAKTAEIKAPAGEEFFGADGSYEAAQREIGDVVKYASRFVRRGSAALADRAFNVESITNAIMGKGSIVPASPAQDPNFLVFRIFPPQDPSGNAFRAELKCIGRRFETVDENNFHVAETVRQTIWSEKNPNLAPRIKDIETISLYRREADGRVSATQRTATFLTWTGTPVQKDKYFMTKGTAIDVRTYDLQYDLVKRPDMP